MIVFSIIYGFIVMSLWAYLSRFYDAKTLPYDRGFTLYANLQWLLIFLNFVFFWGWWSILIFALLLTVGGLVNIPVSMFLFNIFHPLPAKTGILLNERPNMLLYGIWCISIMPLLPILTVINGFLFL